MTSEEAYCLKSFHLLVNLFASVNLPVTPFGLYEVQCSYLITLGSSAFY